MLTTRWQFDDGFAKPLTIEAMGTEEGVLFLWRRSKRPRGEQDATKVDTAPLDIHKVACQMVEELGGHALALDQAGAYIQETSVSFAGYLKLYEQNRRTLLGQYGALDVEHITVATTFKTSFTRARELSPMAEDILHFCAFLQPDAIPEELFQHDDHFQYGTIVFNKAIAALLRYSLIKLNDREQTFSIHRLVQAVLIDTMSHETRQQWRERIVRALSVAFPDAQEFKNWRQCERLLSHALECAKWTEDELTPTVEVAALFFMAGTYLHACGHYSVAETLQSRVLSIYKQRFGDEHLNTALALNNLALTFSDHGKYEQAEPLLERALSIREKHLEAEHPAIAASQSILADVYLSQYKYEQAVPLYQQAISIREKYFGTEKLQLADNLFRLAVILHGWREHAQAEALYQRSISILEQRLGVTDPTTQLFKRMYVDLMHGLGLHANAAALEANNEPSI